MSNKTVSLFACVAALVLTGSVAAADTYLDFGVSELNLNYTAATKQMAITSSNASTLEVWLVDGMSVLDYLQIDASALGANTLYSLNLSFTQFGVNDWRALGTLSLRDTVQEVVAANFTTTDVYIDDDTYGLKMTGFLTPLGANAGLLVPSAYSWDITDGVDTINVPSATSYDTGAMINTTFTTWGGLTEDAFFTGNASLVNGDSRVAITPVPAGVLLGLVGLGMVGVRMRKYA